MLHQLKIWSAVALTAMLTCTPLAVAGNNDSMTIQRFTQDSVRQRISISPTIATAKTWS